MPRFSASLPEGHFEGSTFQFPVRVYYEDTDFSGVVYHASYLRFLERGRTELLRACDVHQGAISTGDAGAVFGFAVASLNVRFIKPARMDDGLIVATDVIELGGASLDLRQRILRSGELLLDANVRIACVANGRPMRIPSEIRQKLTR